MQKWKVQRTAVVVAGGHTGGISAWAVYTDGCPSHIVQPHIQACLNIMGIAAELIPGSRSPFLTIVDYPSRETKEAMNAFGELLAERTIEGPYCDERGRAMILEWYRPARIGNITQIKNGFAVHVVATSTQSLAQTTTGERSCEGVAVGPDGMKLDLSVHAADQHELSARLRLIGNMTRIRWTRTDSATLALLGEPLL